MSKNSTRIQANVVHKDGEWKFLFLDKRPLPRTKEEVVAEAAEKCKKFHQHYGLDIELIIHDIEGKIQDKRTYGHDPKNTKG